MRILSSKDFIKKYNIKDNSMKQSELQRVYNYPKYPRDSKRSTNKGFINIHNWYQGGTHWCCFIIKDNKSHCLDSFGGPADKFLQEQLIKPKIYYIYKTQGIKSRLWWTIPLYFFYLIERMNLNDAVVKMYCNLQSHKCR